MKKEKTFVAVIFGGVSDEHDISIKSAKNVIKALQTGENIYKYNVIYVYIDREGYWWTSEVAQKALRKGSKLSPNELPGSKTSNWFEKLPEGTEVADIWFPVLHGPNCEDGTIQGLLKVFGKKFVGSGVLGSALGMDKLAMKASFAAAGLAQVKYYEESSENIKNPNSFSSVIKRLEQKLGYPCFVKPSNLGSSVGITKAYNSSQLKEGLELAAKYDSRLIIEENVNGRELECAVLGKREMKASIVGEIFHKSDWYDYKTKYTSNLSETLIPAPLSEDISEKIRQLSLVACKTISVNSLARVDFFYKETQNQILINEINTLPGFTNESMYPMLWNASGVSIEQLVAKLVETAKE